mmetsp:Transcript_7345/g.15719  ORF Transcript_7345/g.15719 Transcript_7345/m.15719 type:complete len:137 (-) Transcript_7345:91-501(-)
MEMAALQIGKYEKLVKFIARFVVKICAPHNCNGSNRVENENSDQSLDDSLEEGRCQDITKETSTIVRTKCGHIFQKECLKDWVGGCWSANINSSRSNNDTNNTNGDGSTPDWKIRKARQIHCPLCREDLRPTQLQW